ncbi:MAG: enoyl-CoA hydratase-related protein [Alphaproteobacteria bacterium]|jgi:2-oxoglutaroyl-CoA hydrolase|nr:enoyl-CoA hydratase-related protein [Alphaproteobacteria bacterium]
MQKYAERRAALLAELDGLSVEIEPEKGVAYLILDRPPLNIVSYRARAQIAALFEEFGRDDEVRVVVVRGAGGVYTSGADVKAFPDIHRDGMSHLAWNIAAAERCPKPVICAIEKYAFGVGFELAMACDFRFATEESKLGLPEVSIGQIPGSGGSHRLARIAGLTRAKEVCMLAKRMSAKEALDWGVVTKVVADSAALDAAIEEAVTTLTRQSPLALTTVKRVLNTAYDTSLAVGHEVEGHAYEKLRDSEDYNEGIAAFAEKRKADYKGR